MSHGRNRAMPAGIIYSINPVMERSDLAGMRADGRGGVAGMRADGWPWWRQDGSGWGGVDYQRIMGGWAEIVEKMRQKIWQIG